MRIATCNLNGEQQIPQGISLRSQTNQPTGRIRALSPAFKLAKGGGGMVWNEVEAVDLEETVKISCFFSVWRSLFSLKRHQLSYFTVRICLLYFWFDISNMVLLNEWCLKMTKALFTNSLTTSTWNKKSPDSKQHNDMVLTKVSEPKLVTRSPRHLKMCVQKMHVWPNDDMML